MVYHVLTATGGMLFFVGLYVAFQGSAARGRPPSADCPTTSKRCRGCAVATRCSQLPEGAKPNFRAPMEQNAMQGPWYLSP